MGIRWLFRCLLLPWRWRRSCGRNNLRSGPQILSGTGPRHPPHIGAMVINAHWSALYPWLLAGGARGRQAIAALGFPVAHALSSYVSGAIAAFEIFWTSLLRPGIDHAGSCPQGHPIASAQMWVWLFAVHLGDDGGPGSTDNPDCWWPRCVARAWALASVGNRGRNFMAVYLWLGICLGFGYLAKAILFPMHSFSWQC